MNKPSSLIWVVFILILIFPTPVGQFIVDLAGGIFLIITLIPLILGGLGWLTWKRIQSKIQNAAADVFFGKPDAFELYLFQKKLQLINFEKYKNKRVFIKSCKNKNLPIGAFSIICKKLIPHVKSLFYGEPCSSVPLIKN